MSSEQEAMLRERDSLRAKYGDLLERVSRILFEADPIDLNYKTNTDEYDSEAETILPRLDGAGSAQDVQQIVHEEFCRWFDADEVGPSSNYQAIAESIWELWNASQREV
ncbi:hypothetical protein ABT392_05470 [Paucibacter sp. JuS9]|uniref:hypothetical protein n=1 Tax=Paucibacter sp. JuS9 TaxID=3228748 RepID=UPI003757FECC